MESKQESERIDDYDEAMVTWLAAFLANRLDTASRDDLMAFLSDNPDARELFLMSYKLYSGNGETVRQRNGNDRRTDTTSGFMNEPEDRR